MAKNRISITDYMISDVVEMRKKMGLTAQALSNEIVGRPHWLSNIENRKVTTMLEEDALKLAVYLYGDKKTAISKIEDWLLVGDSIERKTDNGDYSYKDKKKELNRKLNKACKVLHNILEETNFLDEDSIMKDESVITTFIELMSSPEGVMKFKALLGIPLQYMDKRDFKKVLTVAKNNSDAQYYVKKAKVDDNGYLLEAPELDVNINDLFL